MTTMINSTLKIRESDALRAKARAEIALLDPAPDKAFGILAGIPQSSRTKEAENHKENEQTSN